MSLSEYVRLILCDIMLTLLDEAIMMAKDDLIEGVNVGKAKNGREYLRSNPNGSEGDNLDSKPIF